MTMTQSENEKADFPRIMAVLPRGEAIRNFVYTEALSEVARYSDLSILSVIPNEKIYRLLIEKYGTVNVLEESPELWLPGFTREILDMAHGRWLWSEAAKERWRLRDRESISIPQKIKRLGKKLVALSFANQPGLSMLSHIESILSWQLRTPNQYLRLLKDFRPNLVFNGSHVHSRVALPVIHAAHALGIPTAAFIFSWDNLTSQGRIFPPYDYYLVWNNAIKEQLLNIYPHVHADHVFVTGTPQFDFHFRPEYIWTREDFCANVGADPHRPIVLYTTGMSNHMPGEPRIVEGIADMLAEMTEFGPPQLLVRVYPKDQTGRFDDLRQSRKDILFPVIPWEPNWLTPLLEDTYMLTNMLCHADLGINIASTVSLELCMFGKPVINVGYNPPQMDVHVDFARYYEFDHYRPIVASGAISMAWTESEMRNLLFKTLNKKNEHLPEQQNLLEIFFEKTLDGKSSERVAATLLKLAHEKS